MDRRYLRVVCSHRGVTLVELMAAILISSIVITGLVAAYATVIEEWRRESDRIMMFNEGTVAIGQIEKAIWGAKVVINHETMGRPSDRITVVKGAWKDQRNRRVEGSMEFFYNSQDQSLRWNNLTGGHGEFNQRLLPSVRFNAGPQSKPYITLKKVAFTTIDMERPWNPSMSGYAFIKIELVLQGTRDDTLYLSSIVAKRNIPD